MFRTIKYSIKGKPLIDVNEQGVFYSYNKRKLKELHKNRENNPYYCWKDGRKTYYAHIEVAKAFPEICGEWFEGAEVHHKDGNTLNNEATNLIVCTKKEHMEFHHLMKIKEGQEEKEKKDLKELIDEFRKNGKYRVCCYCRKSKVKKNGYSPIEVSITQKNKRYLRNTGFYAKPSDFQNQVFPDGFKEYLDNLKY